MIKFNKLLEAKSEFPRILPKQKPNIPAINPCSKCGKPGELIDWEFNDMWKVMCQNNHSVGGDAINQHRAISRWNQKNPIKVNESDDGMGRTGNWQQQRDEDFNETQIQRLIKLNPEREEEILKLKHKLSPKGLVIQLKLKD